MPYAVELNRTTGKMRLNWVGNPRRGNIGEPGASNRRVLVNWPRPANARGKRHYHATKGGRLVGRDWE